MTIVSVRPSRQSHYRKSTLFVIVLLGLGGASLITWIALGGLSYTRTLWGALDAYRQSRGPGIAPESFAFISRGIRAGMRIQAVDSIMSDCREMACFSGVEEFQNERLKHWTGPVKLYICEYRPQWYNPLFQRTETLVSEWFWVFFDEEGRARRILRTLQKGSASKNMSIDLDKRTISEP